jgi:hypothetical protein
MAMSASGAKADLKAKLEAAFAAQGKSVGDDPLLAKVCEAFGDWLVNQITTTAKVEVPSGSSAGTYDVT